MVNNMKKTNYNNIITNITNTINAPSKNINTRNDLSIYTFYLTFAVLVISQLLFINQFTYFTEFFTLNNGFTLNSFTVTILICIVALCLSVLFLKPHITNKLLYIFTFIVIALFVINYILIRISLNYYLYLATLISVGIFLGLLINSTIFMILYSLGTKQKINVLLCSFLSLILFLVIRHFIVDFSKTFNVFILPLISLVLLLFIMSFLGKDYFKEIEMTNERIPISPIAFFVILFAVYILTALSFYVICKNHVLIFEGINLLIFACGILITIIIARIIFQCSKMSNLFYILLWLVCSIIAFQFLLFINEFNRIVEIILLVLLGISLGFGFIANYMILGVCLEDKSSLSLFRFCLMSITILCSMGLALKSLFYKMDKFLLAICSQSFIFLFGCVLVVSLIKVIIYNLKSEIKQTETQEEEVIIDTKYPNPYELLTNKEVIVFEQLLLGNTLRQIAGELHMKYDTVNFHYKNIYRKLEVNSRIELIVRYGKKVK